MVISRAALVASYQPKLESIARHSGIELTAVEPIAMNGSFHMHWFPRLARRIAATRPDVVHIEEEPGNVATWHATRLARHHGAHVMCFTWQNIHRRYPPPFSTMERQTLRRVDHLVGGSRAAVDVARAKGYRGPTSVLPQVGVDPTAWTPPTEIPRAQPFTIGYAGRFVSEKGVDLLVQAFTQLRGDVRLVLVGEGPTRDRL